MSKNTRRQNAPNRAASSRITAASSRRYLRDFISSVLPVVALFVVTRVAVAAPYYIPSGSMEPTLLVGDRLMVNKLRYGPHLPWLHVELPGYADPQRGDVAVFESPPQDPSIRIAPDIVTPTLVKRIVGMPGDEVAMRNGVLLVNGMPETGLPPAVEKALGVSGDLARGNAASLEVRGWGDQPLPVFNWQHGFEVMDSPTGRPPTEPTVHNWGPLRVPDGMYFMMGDNRDDSVDSRFYGMVPRENITGRAGVVFHSYDTTAGAPLLRAVTEMRWDRIGRMIR